MKIKKLYAEPEMRLHKLSTSRIIAVSPGEQIPVVTDHTDPGQEENEGD